MPSDGRLPKRRSVRLRAFDYARPGAYFVTICTHARAPLFGDIAGGVMRLSPVGRIVSEEWARTQLVRPSVRPDAFVVMPDHVHGIMVIADDRAGIIRRVDPGARSGSGPGSVGAIVGQFKAAVTKRINAGWPARRGMVWQRGYYEHVIRNRASLDRIRRYIAANPSRWEPPSSNP